VFQHLYKKLFPIFFANWLATLGSVLATVAVILLALAFFMNIYSTIVQRDTNPYFGVVSFMILPGIMVAGLILVAVGYNNRRRRERLTGREPVALQEGGPAFYRKVAIFGGMTFLVLVLFTSFSYEAYHFTDSTAFCGQVCHEVMAPEFTAYERSPHANVTCVSCHIGPGASWFVRSKLSGVRQVFAVLRNSYSRPIPAPVHNLRPARETCEVCHWPAKFHGSSLVVREHFESDRENSPSVSAVIMRVGGIFHAGVSATGIHWHIDPRNEVRYRTLDEKRQDIVEVVQKTPDGEIRYLREGADPDDATGEWRVMDCIDCHNRPTHIFETPDQALDAAFLAGLLDHEVPYLRKVAEQVLFEVKPDGDTAQTVANALTRIYEEDHLEELAVLQTHLDETASVLSEILDRNVYPTMNITWGTYASNLSHFDDDGDFSTGGCFRCHDEEHISEAGDTISQDCDNCHVLLAEREEDLAALPEFVLDFLTQR
jgi:hypothetical protein